MTHLTRYGFGELGHDDSFLGSTLTHLTRYGFGELGHDDSFLGDSEDRGSSKNRGSNTVFLEREIINDKPEVELEKDS